MLRLYLNCAENPEEIINRAQCGGEELVTVLMKAAENMVYEISEFKGRFGPMKIFLENLEFKRIAAENGNQISRFMEDCRRELNGK